MGDSSAPTGAINGARGGETVAVDELAGNGMAEAADDI
jgi:hypothetical protein